MRECTVDLKNKTKRIEAMKAEDIAKYTALQKKAPLTQTVALEERIALLENQLRGMK